MLRTMVFSDHLNFDIGIQYYYKNQGLVPPALDYDVLFENLTNLVRRAEFHKAFLFYPKPDQFLMQEHFEQNKYNWINGMKNSPYLDVIESSYIARPTIDHVPMDIRNKDSYYKVEKGTDINLALHAVTKATFNSYDLAIFLSADTDYIPLYDTLRTMGKMVVVIVIEGQHSMKIKPHVDEVIYIGKTFFSKSLRPERTKNKGGKVILNIGMNGVGKSGSTDR